MHLCSISDFKGSGGSLALMAKSLYELWEKKKVIRRRLKNTKSFVRFPKKQDDDEKEDGVKENPTSTAAMEMNLPALTAMFSFYKVKSGKQVPIGKLEGEAASPI